MRTLRPLSLLALAATWLLLLVGATVSATGAGLACPDWPLCHGRLLPPLERLVLVEYGHRLLASAVGVLVLALAVLTWKHARGPGGLARGAAGLLVLLAVQVGLGGATVLSSLAPVIVGVHLGTAMAFMAVLTAFAVRAHMADGGPAARDATGRAAACAGDPGLPRLVMAAAVLVYLQILLGGFTSAFGAGLACGGLPLCHGAIIPAGPPPAVLHAVHRALGVGAAGVVAAVAVRARRSHDAPVRRGAAAAAALGVVQVALGVLNVTTRLALEVRVAHLGGAAALLAALVALAVWMQHARALRAEPVASAAPTSGPSAPHRPAPGPTPGRSVVRLVGDYVALTKPRIVALLLLTTVTTMVVAGGHPGAGLVVFTMLGGALAAGSANAINCYWDRDIDALMRRTRGRPLPAGRVAPRHALAFGLALAVLAVVVLGLRVNWLSAALALAGIVFYVGVYTVWLKRSTPQNIVIGGAAGAVPPLVGWAAVTDQVALPAFMLFAIIFLWTPPHFWALALHRQDEYRAAGVPMLPVVAGPQETLRQMLGYTLALVAATLALAGLGVLGRVYLLAAVVLAVPFLVLVLRLARRPTPQQAWAVFEYSVLYLGLLFAAMAVDRLVG
ncbi:MAG: heme o synthase [Armatimonadota bacterium]|nr:heme o synthase [Armatimonadota bacterium]MDR7534597.1 heme o synthase [Armatimonadota bacterium]MDR7536234.1 heme o synthase [Armatimonadota bacterium]